MRTIGSLFSGIGGLELGLERAGLGRTIWQAESDPFCRRVLAKHWPNVRQYTDIREIDQGADIMCGGFPCQDLSSATHGLGDGLEGEKSGLWFAYLDVVRKFRPDVVIVENVDTWRRWLPTVRGDLENLGYVVEAYALAAENVGAPHIRARVFAVAYANPHEQPACTLDAQAPILQAIANAVQGHWRSGPPGGFRVADGISPRVDRCRAQALGNAVVPQVAEIIGLEVKRVIG